MAEILVACPIFILFLFLYNRILFLLVVSMYSIKKKSFLASLEATGNQCAISGNC